MLATTDALDAVFSDTSIVQAMLDVEAALARAEAKAGVIPKDAAEAIGRAATARDFDAATLVREARASGTIAVPLVAVLTERVRAFNVDAARFVHWGATSQDIVDTALVLLINRASASLAADHARLSSALRTVSDRHAGDVMLGRTLLQPAPPTTFGLKAAGWLAGASRGWSRFKHARHEACVLQFGGASGTLAALGDRGLVVADALARELGLPAPDAPWHAYRDRLAALVAACGIYTGVLGKMARDVSLLMQSEVGEAAEPGGGSSTMPHKQNPVGCAIALAAATRMPGNRVRGAVGTRAGARACRRLLACRDADDRRRDPDHGRRPGGDERGRQPSDRGPGADARQHRPDERCDLRGARDDEGRQRAWPRRGAQAGAGRHSARTRHWRATRPARSARRPRLPAC